MNRAVERLELIEALLDYAPMYRGGRKSNLQRVFGPDFFSFCVQKSSTKPFTQSNKCIFAMLRSDIDLLFSAPKYAIDQPIQIYWYSHSKRYIKVAQVNGSGNQEVNHKKLQVLEDFLRGYSQKTRKFQLEDDVFELLEGTDFPLQDFTGDRFARQPANKAFSNCESNDCSKDCKISTKTRDEKRQKIMDRLSEIAVWLDKREMYDNMHSAANHMYRKMKAEAYELYQRLHPEAKKLADQSFPQLTGFFQG